MYGTIARMKVKEGHEQALLELERTELASNRGVAPEFLYVYKLDGSKNEYLMVVAFESQEAYRKNAESPEQHERYQRVMEHLDSPPEWSDGQIIFSHP